MCRAACPDQAPADCSSAAIPCRRSGSSDQAALETDQSYSDETAACWTGDQARRLTITRTVARGERLCVECVRRPGNSR